MTGFNYNENFYVDYKENIGLCLNAQVKLLTLFIVGKSFTGSFKTVLLLQAWLGNDFCQFNSRGRGKQVPVAHLTLVRQED